MSSQNHAIRSRNQSSRNRQAPYRTLSARGRTRTRPRRQRASRCRRLLKGCSGRSGGVPAQERSRGSARPVPEYCFRCPVIERIRGGKDAGIVPCPEQGKSNRDESIPPEPEPAPEREDQNGKNGVAQEYAPRVGMPQSGRVVQCKSPGNPPLKGHNVPGAVVMVYFPSSMQMPSALYVRYSPRKNQFRYTIGVMMVVSRLISTSTT